MGVGPVDVVLGLLRVLVGRPEVDKRCLQLKNNLGRLLTERNNQIRIDRLKAVDEEVVDSLDCMVRHCLHAARILDN